MSIEELYQLFCKSKGVTTDTRNCKPGSLFFALTGEHFNGNKFTKQAFENGASYAVVDELYDNPTPQLILVKDVLETLTSLAKYHRQKLGKPVLAITGSNGKTTTKELIATVLSTHFSICFTQGNYNNHIGVPLTLLSAKPTDDIIITEMGANHPGEIGYLSKIAEPDYGLITNIGKAHLEGFGSFENIIKTKKELYDYIQKTSGKIFINSSDSLLVSISKDIKCIPYENDFSLSLILQNPFLSFQYKDAIDSVDFSTSFIGSYNVPNFKAAITIGRYFKVPTAKIIKALETYQPGNNRSQLHKTAHNTLILDAYNSNPSSLTEAVKNFISLNHANKQLILGDMKELGEYSLEEHQRIADLLENQPEIDVMLIGPEFVKTQSKWPTFERVEQASNYLKSNFIKDALILLKGSRSMKLEELIPLL